MVSRMSLAVCAVLTGMTSPLSERPSGFCDGKVARLPAGLAGSRGGGPLARAHPYESALVLSSFLVAFWWLLCSSYYVASCTVSLDLCYFCRTLEPIRMNVLQSFRVFFVAFLRLFSVYVVSCTVSLHLRYRRIFAGLLWSV